MLWREILQILLYGQILLHGTYSESEGAADICDSPLTQGLDDSQFSASSEYDQTHNASAARADSDGWIASEADQYQYLKLDLEDSWEITKVNVQGSTKGWFTRSFRLSYSDDGYVWIPHSTRLLQDRLGELFTVQETTTVIDPPIKVSLMLSARYVAINPVSFHKRPSLRIELYGCKHLQRPTAPGKTVPTIIDADTTLIPSQNPIIVDHPVVIRPGVTLTVQAGVYVIFTSKDAGVDVWGTFIAHGITGLEVLLSSNEPVLAANSKWKGIVQKAGGNITIGNTIVRQAVTGVQGNGSRIRLVDSTVHSCLHGVQVSGGSVDDISNVDMATDIEHISLLRAHVQDNVDGLIVHGTISNPNIYIGHSAFGRNKDNGIVILNWDFSEQDTPTNLVIFNTSFSENNIGIKSNSLNLVRFYISHSSFIRNAKAGLQHFLLYRRYDVLTVYINISYSQFLENDDCGMMAEVYCYRCKILSLHKISLTNNSFSREKLAIKIDYTLRYTAAEASIRIDNNIFASNIQDVNLYNVLNDRVEITTENNSFWQSRVPLTIVSENAKENSVSMQWNDFTDCHSISDAIKIKGVTARILYNTFKNCSMSSMVVLMDGTEHSFAFNSLINTNVSKCYLKIDQEYDENSYVIVDNNYWGTTDMTFVKSRICDFFHDSTKAVVKLDLYFSNEKMQNASSSVLVDNFRAIKDAEYNVTYIGGIIRTSFNFSAIGDDKLILNRSILILDNVHVDIGGVSIIVMKNRGIKVYGSLTIGERYDTTRNTLLQLEGEISSRNKWNGISMHSSENKFQELKIYNLEIEGTDTFLEVDGNGSAITLYNCSSTNNQIHHLISVDVSGGNFSLIIENSSITTLLTLVNVRYAITDIDITVLNSNLQSKKCILDVRETNQQENITQFNLYISSSTFTFYSNLYWLMYLEGCSTHFTSTFIMSTFSATVSNHYGLSLLKYPSIDLTAVGNSFGNGGDILKFVFCGNLPSNYTKVINITGNLFKSLLPGHYVSIQAATSQEQNHNFYITSNTFDGNDVSFRTGISCYSRSRISRHSLDVDSNVFRNITQYATYAECGTEMVIRNNLFVNNSKCISVHGGHTYQPIDGLEIFGNIFLNNTHPDGIIYLDRPEYGHQIVKITENQFKRNTGTVIAFKSPGIRFKHNIFENQEALYNVKVLSGHYTEQISVNASLNYWGTTNVREIMKGIYDSNYDKTLLHVNFRPYLASKNLSDIQNAEVGLSFISEEDEVGGNVNGNITLLLNDSPYLVISNIYVNETDTLSLEAGVELRMKAGMGIYVQGKLNIFGRKEQPVKLISEIIGQPWTGLDFSSDLESVLSYVFVNDTMQGLTFRRSAVHIQNVTSSYSRQSGITVSFQSMQKDVNFSFYDVILENNLEYGIRVSGNHYEDAAVVTVSNCLLARNRRNGMQISSDARIELFNCSIVENDQGGINVRQYRGGILFVNNSLLSSNLNYAIEGELDNGIVIESCSIRNHTFGYFRSGSWQTRAYIKVQRKYWYEKGTYAIFRNTHFQGNTAGWIEILNNRQDYLNVVFEKNVFTGGRRTLLCKTDGISRKMSVVFVSNTLQGNSVQERYTESALLEFYIDDKSIYDIEMSDNNFTKNSARVCLAVSSHLFNINNGNITVSENVFQDNNVSLSVIDIKGCISPQIHRNIFTSVFPNTCIISASEFHLSKVINATHNYWGTSVPKHVVESACGFEKDMKNALILTFPYFENENLTTLVFATQQRGSGLFGGEIDTDTYITQEEWGSPIKIDRSIIIREGAGLYVQSGVVLKFAENRGIYVQGSLVTTGGDSAVVLESDTFDSFWYGIVINSTSNNSTGKVQMYKTWLQNTMNGIVAYSRNFEIKRSKITNSRASCLTLFPNTEIAIYDFEFTIFEACRSYGINSKNAGRISIRNAYITNSTSGISVSSAHDKGGNISIIIAKNTFESVTESVLSVTFPSNDLNSQSTSKIVRVEQNKFKNSCGVLIQTWNNAETTFRNNDLSSADCSRDSECFMRVLSNGTETFTRYRQFDISANRFENISDKCIIDLKDSGIATLQGSFVYNTLNDNKATDGIVLANSRYFNISRNIFDNPASLFDVITELKGSDSINVTNNWWGRSEQDHVFSRIADQRRVPNLIMFEVEPVLLDLSVDCSGVNNCSSHGKCISPNHCRCSSGWTGLSCMQFDCSGVHNCYGNGVCIGPNECSCREGWSGAQCVIASCSKLNNCSGHGFCVQPNYCTCADRFTGNECNSCLPLHGGPSCQPCPECQHGTCSSKTGLCECEDINWTGYLCDKCSESFYGSNCLPLIKLLEILPDVGPEVGGGEVHVWGHNFKETLNNTYKCRFGNTESEGKWLAWNHVVCFAPRHPEGRVTLEISPDGLEYTNDQLIYFFYSTCPQSSCGRGFSPAHGQCVFGTCSCFLPWTGENCTVELIRPIIAAVDFNQTATESETYTIQLKLIQGHLPVRWYLAKGPTGMTVDENLGFVRWSNAFAKTSPYHIDVRASNVVGEDSITWSLFVPASYTVYVQHIEPEGVLPVPQPIKVFGKVVFLEEDEGQPTEVLLIITSIRSGRQTFLKTVTDQVSTDDFMTIYYPRPDDVGLFTVVATHPGISLESSATNITWSVLGMQCNPSTAYVDLKINLNGDTVVVANISTLYNIGDLPLHNITGVIDGLSETYVRETADLLSSNFIIERLEINGNSSFDLIINNTRPLYGTIFIIFTTKQGTSTGLKVNIKLFVLKPLLSLEPPLLHENIVRGTIRIIDVNVTNIGEISANDISVSLPNDPRLSLISLTSESDRLAESTDGMFIQPQEVAHLSISVVTENTEPLGEMIGTIYINSKLTSGSLPYTFFITSIRRFNVTFTIKDEYTYFASGSPLVSNAKVRLSNPRRGFFETKYTTNETGHVVFENVYEDKYSLYAEAGGHSSYGAVIVITPDTTEQDIFLQRVAVKYTWTVEPTTVADVYIIQLESTFETYVPMPVVTIEPAKVNTIPLELEEIDTIDFQITNHGLIRADNVRFTFPTGHPYLTFESTVDFIGSVDANTSIIVPVKATLKHRVKRNAAARSVCGLGLRYDYICGGTQTRHLDVTLTRGYPGTPPLPCGRFRLREVSDSNGGRITGRGYSVTYNPTTPLSCDCAKNLIKSCYLSFIPYVRCATAAADLKRSDGSAKGDLSAAVGVMDTAFACVIGFACPLCGTVYTSIRCLTDVALKCPGRRRRDISSEVVYNMLSTARPMDNFLHMMTEVFGDDEMYSLGSLWYPAFQKTLGDESELSTLLSNSEATSVLDTLTGEAAKANLSNFLDRWNNTAAAWENGTLTELEDTSRVVSLTRLTPRIEQYLIDTENAESKGFVSIFDEFEHAVNAYKTAEQQQSSSSGASQKDGICARVRVRIVQELVLTRDAFNARLEIENGESSDLESIKVEIQIKQTFGTGGLTNDKFSVGYPTLIGISDIDGSGTLGRDLSGSAEWLIIPYSNAAPEDDTKYDVGGLLSYSVGGSQFTVPLLPDTITVKPNPSLVVHYFHEKYVRGDDALTPEVEPIIPFSLAVMVMNNGYGVARALKITSGQPEIIENEKGLLVTFKIIGAQLGNNPITHSLSVDFGDITSFETKTAKWLMTTTLMGTFFNYSATLENINPLGDPQLSLIDEIGYHELIQLVRIVLPEQDDGLDDFLVNDFIDWQGLPDRLYNSANGSDVADINIMNITDIEVTIFRTEKTYKYVRLTVNTNTALWFYVRVENTFTSPDPADNENLLYVEAADDRELLVDKNVWQTTHILDKFYLHLLDFIENNSTEEKSTEIQFQYVLIYGPRNMYAPRFNASSYTATIPKSMSAGSEVVTVNAYDIDKDRIEFNFSNESVTQFNISASAESSAVIVVNKSPMEPGFVILGLIARDSGIPARSTFINVTIQIRDNDVTDATVTSTVGHSTTVSSSNNVTAPTAIKNTTRTTFVTTETNTKKAANTTFSSTSGTLSLLENVSMVSTAYTSTQTNISQYTGNTSITTRSISTTTPASGSRDEQEGEDVLPWVIPVSVGIAVLVTAVVAVVCVLRKKT